jgi:uncharacterized membrane protein YfhO
LTDNALFTILNNGRVGIGTTSPTATLHIKNDNPAFRLEDVTSGDNHYLIGNNVEFRIQTTGYFSFRPNNTEAVVIKENGNVGIGTTSPNFKLDVSGTGHFSEALTLDKELNDKNGEAGTSGQILSSTGDGID